MKPPSLTGAKRSGARPWLWAGGIIILSFVLAGFAAWKSMTRPMPFTADQRATISPEAAARIDKERLTIVPDFIVPLLVKREAVIEGRRSFAESERPHEQEIITRYGLKLEKIKIAGMPVTVITPPSIAPELQDVIALNIHGGAFVLGTSHDRMALLMAHDLGMKVYSVEYSLAPEAPHPVANEECLYVYSELVRSHDPRRIVVIGSSSGGAQVLAMLNRARAQGMPMAAGVGLFTPSADISGAGDSVVANNGRDVLLRNFAANIIQNFYAPGKDLRHPDVSPIYADYGPDFPPTIISTATRDLNLSSGVRLHDKLDQAGVPTKLLVAEGLWHGFNWEIDLPEAIRVRAAVARFLQDTLRSPPER